MIKKSIHFLNDREVRAVWDEKHSKWWFSTTDIVRAINDEEELDSDTMSLRSGSVQAQITINNIEPFEIMIPSKDDCSEFANKVDALYKNIVLHNQVNNKLTELQTLLLAKMGQ